MALSQAISELRGKSFRLKILPHSTLDTASPKTWKWLDYDEVLKTGAIIYLERVPPRLIEARKELRSLFLIGLVDNIIANEILMESPSERSARFSRAVACLTAVKEFIGSH
jgi:hypothetical protein